MRSSTTDTVHEKLRESIISGELPSGSHHSIYRLAQQFGVSRTPVRDAILRLADSGMVEIERNRGVRIRGLSVSDIRDIFELRLLVEVPAARVAAQDPSRTLLLELDERLESLTLAADRSDLSQFMLEDRLLHRAIISASGNNRLLANVEALRDATAARGVSTMDQSRSLDEIQNEHTPIVEAIRARDPHAASICMQTHLVETGRLLLQQVSAETGEVLPPLWPTNLVSPQSYP